MNQNNSRRARVSRKDLFRGVSMAGLALIITLVVAYPSQEVVREFNIIIAFLVLFLVILAAVVSDVIGVAAAVAEEQPFHAMNARRLPGAKHAILLVRNGDRINSLGADLIGDVCGTVAGAAGAAIVFRLAPLLPAAGIGVLTVVMISLVAALMVGGKAAAKGYALRRHTEVVYLMGRLWYTSDLAMSRLGMRSSRLERRL